MEKYKPKETIKDEMEIPKEFAYRLRDFELQNEVHLLIHNKVEENIKKYVNKMHNVKLTEGQYHCYFGDVKILINSFITCWSVVIDEIIREADRLAHTATQEDLLTLLNQTVVLQQSRQCSFAKEFLPAKTDTEREIYEDIETKYEVYMAELNKLRDEILTYDKYYKVDNFRKKHFYVLIQSESEMFAFAQLFLAVKVSEHLYAIRVSLEEILLRITKEGEKMQCHENKRIVKLLNELYDRNTELRELSRLEHRRSVDMAEVLKAIELVREKIAQNKQDVTLPRIEEEIAYWKTRIEGFNVLEADYKELNDHMENVAEQERQFLSKIALEQTQERIDCWDNIGENYREKREELESKINKAALAVMSFFTVRGADRIHYKDQIGTHTFCDYGHQVYHLDYNLTDYHLTCEGGKQKETDSTPYYFDKDGRYILGPNKEKLYQYAPCGSTYKLGEEGTFEKTSAECGHSEQVMDACQVKTKHNSHRHPPESLPICEPMDVKETLDSETVTYLWDTFGGILSEALSDVLEARPSNPIHLLAHKILHHHHGKTRDELRKKQEEADNYRANIKKKLKEQAERKALAWMSNQVNRKHLNKVSDDAPAWHAVNSFSARNEFIYLLDSYN